MVVFIIVVFVYACKRQIVFAKSIQIVDVKIAAIRIGIRVPFYRLVLSAYPGYYRLVIIVLMLPVTPAIRPLMIS